MGLYLLTIYLERLHSHLKEEWDKGQIDPLLLAPAYIIDFLCIHPFTDGNGRMARLEHCAGGPTDV